jgi:hypothetical protein
MNELSNRLFNALCQPALSSVKKSTSFYPSSVSIKIPSEEGGLKTVGTCLRQQYYRYTEDGITNIGPPDYQISADLGDLFHAQIVDYIKKHGFQMGLQLMYEEHPIYDPIRHISGRCDIIAWDRKYDEIIGIEVKSVGDYKSSVCIESPSPEHVMQSMLYLDWYRTNIPEGMVRPTKWYLWYIARNEGYAIKTKKHGSPLQNLWDFVITLNEDGTPNIYTPEGRVIWSDYNLEKIYERYETLAKALQSGSIPDRDYELVYSEERIANQYKLDLLTRKADKEKVAKWLNKGAPEGKLKLEMGDFECKLCAYKDLCWNNSNTISPSIFNLPASKEITIQPRNSSRKLL